MTFFLSESQLEVAGTNAQAFGAYFAEYSNIVASSGNGSTTCSREKKSAKAPRVKANRDCGRHNVSRKKSHGRRTSTAGCGCACTQAFQGPPQARSSK